MKKFNLVRELEKFCNELPHPFPRPCLKLLLPVIKKYRYHSHYHQQNLFYVVRDFVIAVLLKRLPPEHPDTFINIVDPDGKYSSRTKILRYILLSKIYEELGYEVPVPVKAIVREKPPPTKKVFRPEAVKVIIKNTMDLEEPLEWGSVIYEPEYVRLFIAILFTYGVRRYEFFRMTPKDISIYDKSILVRSAKGSVVRHHLLYDEILPIVEDGINYLRHPRDERYLNNLFVLVLSRSNVKRSKWRNIHGVRKTLASLLLQNGANPVFVNDFMRWKGRGTMLEFYANLDPVYVDQEIKKYHPFLSFFDNQEPSKNSNIPTPTMN